MSTLYRKYRPQTFSDVIGQNHVKITLQHEIEQGKIGHAYLFCGPRGLGKTTLARLLAKAINCEKRKEGEAEPCNTCRSCTSITSSSAVDIIEIDAASHTGVDNVRENIIENARFTPNISKYKVFIIDEVHMLSSQAFNALLKTLEEPPSHAIFILCTTETHKLPQTIISRCQRFDLKKVSSKDLKARLEKIAKAEGKKIEGLVLDNIVLHSEGCVRDAESLLGKIFTLGDDITAEQAEIILPRSDFNQISQFLNFIVENNSTAAIELLNNLVEDGFDLQVFVESLLEFMRKIMLIKVSGNLSDFGIELDEALEKSAEDLAKRFDYNKLVLAIDIFMSKRQEIKSALIQQFPLEIAVIQLTKENQKIKDQSDDDSSDDESGSKLASEDLSKTQKVKEKIKDKLSYLNPRRHRDNEVPLENINLKKENVDDIKVDMTSSDDKLDDGKEVKLSRVQENWKEIVVKLLEENYTLSSLLRISEPLKCDDNILEIAVKNKFYHDRIMNYNNKLSVEKVISEVLKSEIKIKPLIRDEINPISMEIEGINTSVEASGQPLQITEETKEKFKNMDKVSIDKPADVTQDVISMF
ncbi:MAG: DNA polymerase III subunit gamma/tau [Candidatus Buchananbacteria bacterium]|nr:DNA polymerase III subunit gamma/tau [Candidatus Buchananbacteria bacterium]